MIRCGQMATPFFYFSMLKTSLLTLGALLLCVNQWVQAIPLPVQFIAFLTGVVCLGIPHGAADLLVAANNAKSLSKPFSEKRFFVVYLGRLVLFAATLYFLPVWGNLLFIAFAAYHFGETDLHQFKTDTLLGKALVLGYGLVILSVLLLHHFDEVQPLYALFKSGKEQASLLAWIGQNRYLLLSLNGILFFVTAFVYFLRNPPGQDQEKGYFLVRLALLLFILFQLPLLLGFTFYFVVWHSTLSLKNIVDYLRKNQGASLTKIWQQIFTYSGLALLGLGLFGWTGFYFMNENAIIGYVFLSLAVLTAPHMEIMYQMYHAMRQKSYTNKDN